MSSKGTEPDSAGPFDELVDAAIFAPLGLALEYRKLMPELAETGRKQIAFARTLGRAALSTMASSASRRATSGATAATAATATPAAPAAADPSIEGYDEMNAKQIIAAASTASAAEVAWMIERERTGKQRKTVLAKLARRSD